MWVKLQVIVKDSTETSSSVWDSSVDIINTEMAPASAHSPVQGGNFSNFLEFFTKILIILKL